DSPMGRCGIRRSRWALRRRERARERADEANCKRRRAARGGGLYAIYTFMVGRTRTTQSSRTRLSTPGPRLVIPSSLKDGKDRSPREDPATPAGAAPGVEWAPGRRAGGGCGGGARAGEAGGS